MRTEKCSFLLTSVWSYIILCYSTLSSSLPTIFTWWPTFTIFMQIDNKFSTFLIMFQSIHSHRVRDWATQNFTNIISRLVKCYLNRSNNIAGSENKGNVLGFHDNYELTIEYTKSKVIWFIVQFMMLKVLHTLLGGHCSKSSLK